MDAHANKDTENFECFKMDGYNFENKQNWLSQQVWDIWTKFGKDMQKVILNKDFW